MEVYFIVLGTITGLVGGVGSTAAIMTIRHDRDRRRAQRFLSACALARHQNETMQSTRASRGPCGQDWCDLYDELQPHEED